MLRSSFPAVLAFCLGACGAASASGQEGPAAGRVVHAPANPILADGDYYSADPAPLVVGETLYVLAGRDEAPPGVNDFIMREWQLLATDAPESGEWRHFPGVLRPEDVFAWAEPGRAYASQIVQGRDGKFYLYAPVIQSGQINRDAFAIGVAVADRPTGPWRDAHPAGPIASQSVPVPNDIQNIDPTVLIDDDGRAYMYWGTFGRLLGVELDSDMVTPLGRPVRVETLTGFFEAPWLFKRGGVYYMAYAANNAGPESDCTPARYHACIAYGTAESPLGPWTYRGVIMDPLSSTTSHPGIVEHRGRWLIAYHTADARGGGYFRRSVAVDPVEWDDSVSPPAIRKIQPTRRPLPDRGERRNIAPAARVAVSNAPVPTQFWTRALHDERVEPNPLPPDMWAAGTGTGTGTGTAGGAAQHWALYQWDAPVTVDGARLYFWADQPAGSGAGVAPPRAWRLEYWDGRGWAPIPGAEGADPAPGAYEAVAFAPVMTRCVRAVFDASTDGTAHAGVALQEWEVLAVRPVRTDRVPPRTATGAPAASPDCAG